MLEVDRTGPQLVVRVKCLENPQLEACFTPLFDPKQAITLQKQRSNRLLGPSMPRKALESRLEHVLHNGVVRDVHAE